MLETFPLSRLRILCKLLLGEHNEAYFDSQEFLEEGRESSCKEFEEEEFF
jgi:hypothetical protein